MSISSAAAPPSRLLPLRAGVGWFLRAALTAAFIFGAWAVLLRLFNISPFLGRSPVQVWHYIFSGEEASAHRHVLAHLSAVTLQDAGLGLLSGTVCAVACAVMVTLWRSAASVVLPMAMFFRSVPLLAITPLIVVVCGRGVLAVTVIAGLITFFPTLVNVTTALSRAPRELMDLCCAYGAGPVKTLWKVQFAIALPALFASLRIAAPLALTGALLAEWLATGGGLGYAMLTAGAASDYDLLWAGAALSTFYALLVYAGVSALEQLVLNRFAPPRT